jgi:hypothetical protein
MLKWLQKLLQKNNWKNSPAHLLLLSKFRNADSPTRFDDTNYWEAVLKEQPSKVIKRFIEDGALEPADLKRLVDYKFNASDLKTMSKERGLKVSGRKEELILRLIDNDPQAMNEATKDLNLYQCTTEGMKLAENYIEGEKAKRAAAEQEVFNLLTRGEFFKAVNVVANYEASRVFPRGLGIDWKNYDPTSDIDSLKLIFGTETEILEGIEKNRLNQLRLGAGMMLLWGTNTAKQWISDEFETGIHIDGDAACRMFVFHASHFRNMRGYKEAGVKTVEVLGVNDGSTCDECRKINGKKYKLENVPDLPYGKCKCEIGCRCTTVAREFR